MDLTHVAAAFNRWMDDYTNHPGKYEIIERSALRHLNEKLEGKAPSYGDDCAAILFQYMSKPDVVIGIDVQEKGVSVSAYAVNSAPKK